MENWKDLWRKNYEEKEGDTKNLSSLAKSIDFGAKKGGKYLAWAIPERIFKLQDGEYELVRDPEGKTIETETFVSRESIDENTGEVIQRYGKICFLNIKVTWQGRTHIERYPIQDSNARPLTIFTQNDINNSFQRGKTKAIALVSGIGYKMFEQEFEEGEAEEKDIEEQLKKVESMGASAKKVEDHDFKDKKKTEKVKVEVIEKPKKTPNDELFVEELEKAVKPTSINFDKNSLKNETVEEIKVEIKETEKTSALEAVEALEESETIELNKQKRTEIIDKLKGKFISSKEDGDKIKDYLLSVEIKKFDDLNDEQLTELGRIVNIL